MLLSIGGEEWSEKIKKSISTSDIVIVIVTRSALKSQEVEKEVLESIKQGKKIIPAKYQTVSWNDLKWGLEKKQGIQFENKNSLIRHLDEIIFSDRKSKNRHLDNNFDKSMTTETSIRLIKNKQKLYFILVGAIAVAIITLSLIFSNPYILNNNLNNGKELNDSNPISTKTNEENKEKYFYVNTLGSLGTDQGEFDNPSGIATDNNNNIFIADSKNNRIQEFDEFGNFKTQWPIYNLENYSNNLRLFNTTGINDNPPSILGPFAVAVDSEDNVYVADSQNNRIQKFTGNGTYITELFFQGKAQGQKLLPSFVSVDAENNVYIADSKYDIIQKFDNNGTFITEWKSDNVAGIAADSKSTVYATDYVDDHIHIFIPKAGVSTLDYNSK
jgi:hypothetical protein